MSKRRSLKNQLNFVVSSSFCPGQSKRAQRRNGVDTSNKIFSNKTCSKMRALCNGLASFLNEKYPEVCWVRDLKVEHIKAYLISHENWSEKTRTEKFSQLRKLEQMCQNVFGSDISFMSDLKKSQVFTSAGSAKTRKVIMTESDFRLIQRKLMATRSKGKYVLGITYFLGTRIEEAVTLKIEDIDLDQKCINLNNTKGGKHRRIYFGDRPEAVKYLTEVVYTARSNDWTTAGGDLKVESVSRLINRTIKQLQPELERDYSNTGNHSCRKLFARNELERLVGKDLDEVPLETQRKFWPEVQEKLGHSRNHREDLFRVYILGE